MIGWLVHDVNLVWLDDYVCKNQASLPKFREETNEEKYFLILETFFSVKLPLGEIFQIVYTGSLSIIQIASFVAQSKGLIEYKTFVSTFICCT